MTLLGSARKNSSPTTGTVSPASGFAIDDTCLLKPRERVNAGQGVDKRRLGFRSPGLRRVGLLLALAASGLGTRALPGPEPAAPELSSAHSLIVAAGNADDESERLAHLRALASHAGMLLDPPTRAELETLLPFISAWAEGRARAAEEVARGEGDAHRYLHRFFEKATLAWQPPVPPPPRAESMLYPLWALYRGRFLTWCLIEDSSVLYVPERKAAFVGEAERCFDLARIAFPKNQVLRIYAGENLPMAAPSRWDDRAPAWANHQRRALEQLHRIIRWWIAERQLANGEFGGKWGDDVEMWRWWAPVLIGFDDPIVMAAQERLARGNLSRPALAGGYTSQLTDVEHTAEETADTLTPMLHVAGADPAWTGRVRRLLTLADQVWWGNNARGQLQFKHIDFNHERLGANAGRAYDTGYHVRVMQPVLLLWQRTNDPTLGTALTRWLQTWAEAAMGTDNGKPAGIVPAALQWPSGRVGSLQRGWIGPELTGDPMVTLYSWPGHPVAAMTAALLQANVQTGDAQFLAPLLRMAAMRSSHLAAGNHDGPPGGAAWAAHRLPEIINDALAKWRQLTGNTQFDDLLLADASGYVRFVLAGDEAALTQALAGTAHTLSVNWPMFTSEVRFTDRVLSFPHTWPRTLATGLLRVDASLLYSTVTGDLGSVGNFPLNGARWHTLPRDLATVVTINRRDRFAAELFHFGATARDLGVSLLTLDPGNYKWALTSAKGETLAQGEHDIARTGRKLRFSSPAGVLCRLTLVRPDASK